MLITAALQYLLRFSSNTLIVAAPAATDAKCGSLLPCLPRRSLLRRDVKAIRTLAESAAIGCPLAADAIKKNHAAPAKQYEERARTRKGKRMPS
jgi:hypothetical protein